MIMVSPYHWVDGGFDILGTPPMSSNRFVSLALPAGAVLKKFLLRQTNVQLFCSGIDHTAVQPLYMSEEVAFVGGDYDGRILYRSDRDVPFEVTSDFAVGVTTYVCWWHANDSELGFNQECSYAIGAGAPANLDLTVALNPLSPPFTAPSGDWHVNFAALYKL